MGRPPKRTEATEVQILRAFVRAAICEPELPDDVELGAAFDLGEYKGDRFAWITA